MQLKKALSDLAHKFLAFFKGTPVYADEADPIGEDLGIGEGYITEITVIHPAYMSGYPDKTFQPEGGITRAEAVQILFNLLLTEHEDGDIPRITDVRDNTERYYDAVKYLESLEIIDRYPDDTLAPDAEVTRAELVAMLAKFDGGLVESENTFPDVRDDHWAAVYINYAAYRNWIYGYPNGEFKPDKSCTRAETAAIINRLLTRVEVELPNDDSPYLDTDADHWAYGCIMEACIEHEAVEDIYHSILTRYKQAVDGGYVRYCKATVCAELPLANPSERECVYYAHMDINGNGVPDLFIGAGEKAEKAIFDVYSLCNGKPVQLFKDKHVFGSHTNCILCSGGVLAVHWSAADESGTSYYKVSVAGHSLELIESVSTNVSGVSTRYFHNTGEVVEVTKETYDAIRQKYPESYVRYRGEENLNWKDIFDY